MAEPTRTEIEASIEAAKNAMQAIGDDAHFQAMDIEENGLMLRSNRFVYAGRTEDYEPVAHHPVWGEEVRRAFDHERHVGIETGPLLPEERDERWFTMERWADEHFAERQASGEIADFWGRQGWEAAQIREGVEAQHVLAEVEQQPVTPQLRTKREHLQQMMEAAAQRAQHLVRQETEGWGYSL